VTGRAVELVGIYHANGSLRGELAYAVGKLLGTAHCDITHSVVQRKPEWDSMVTRLGLPVVLLHLDGGALEGLGSSVDAFERAVRSSASAQALTLG